MTAPATLSRDGAAAWSIRPDDEGDAYTGFESRRDAVSWAKAHGYRVARELAQGVPLWGGPAPAFPVAAATRIGFMESCRQTLAIGLPLIALLWVATAMGNGPPG